ncbi:MAG: arylesterase [Proteobacteria bacterium]|nr:arylesterase [Pseudomonadota bacterium]
MVSVPSGLLTSLVTCRDSSTCTLNLARWLAPALLALAAAVGAAARPGGVPDADAPALVVLGDSLSAGYGIRVEEGWVALLARRLAEQGYGYRVVNASVSGETSVGGLERLGHVLDRHHPVVLVVELGANDGLRGLPLAQLRDNLAAIVRRARGAGARVLLLGTRLPDNYGPQYSAQFRATFAEVARAEHVPLVPSFIDSVLTDERNFQADRLHPVAAVQGQLLDAIWPALRPLLAPPERR